MNSKFLASISLDFASPELCAVVRRMLLSARRVSFRFLAKSALSWKPNISGVVFSGREVMYASMPKKNYAILEVKL